MDERSKLELMVTVARMYYEEELTQEEIAHKAAISRPMVSRLLTEARKRKLVEIVIHYPWLNDSKLEAALVERFGLQDARILEADRLDYPTIVRGLGVLGAQLLEKYLKSGMTLAISRGMGVYSVMQTLQPKPQMHLRVVQLQGAMGDRLSDGSDLANFLASRFSGEFHSLHAPLLLESREACEALLKEPSIRQTLKLAAQADIALVGIGSLDPEVSSLVRGQQIASEERDKLVMQGIVGDIAGRFFNAEGQVLDIDFNRRLVCLDIEILRKTPIIIGVAGGLPKLPAIRAALENHLINMLVTDSLVARQLLCASDNEKPYSSSGRK